MSNLLGVYLRRGNMGFFNNIFKKKDINGESEEDETIEIEPGKIKKDKIKPLLIIEEVCFKIKGDDKPKIYGLSNVGKLKGGVTCKFYHEKSTVSSNLYKAESVVELLFPDKSKIVALWMKEPIKTKIKDCLITRYEALSNDPLGFKVYSYILKINENYFFLSNENAKNFIVSGIELHTYP